MTPDEAVVAVLAALEAATIPYMIVGSRASTFQGIPRATRDADFVVRLTPEHLDSSSSSSRPASGSIGRGVSGASRAPCGT